MFKRLPENFICQSFSRLIQKYVTSCNTCQGMKYSNKPLLGQVTILHVGAPSCTGIILDFLNMSLIVTYWSILSSNIPSEDNLVIFFLRL